MIAQFAAVGIGAALGGWLRWGLSIWLNPRAPAFPLGTLASNLIGGSQAFHRYLKQHGIPHVWNVDEHGHDREGRERGAARRSLRARGRQAGCDWKAPRT